MNYSNILFHVTTQERLLQWADYAILNIWVFLQPFSKATGTSSYWSHSIGLSG